MNETNRNEVIKLIDAAKTELRAEMPKPPTDIENLEYVPYHAIVISLLMAKLGITDDEVTAHQKELFELHKQMLAAQAAASAEGAQA